MKESDRIKKLENRVCKMEKDIGEIINSIEDLSRKESILSEFLKELKKLRRVLEVRK
jgi:hypothetical protein